MPPSRTRRRWARLVTAVPLSFVALSGAACREGATDIAVGQSHVCAHRSGGEVVCWGGDRSFDSNASGLQGHLPAFGATLQEATRLSAAGGCTCAVLGSGRVACWSGGGRWCVDRGLFDRPPNREAPYGLVSGLNDARDVTVGQSHACALQASGHVFCWGEQSRGQLGTETDRDRTASVRVPGIEKAVSVAAGRLGTCAALEDGRLLCWGAPQGADESDQCASPSCSPRPRAASVSSMCREDCPDMPDPSVREVAGISEAVEAVAGQRHTCVRRRDGSVACFGDNGLGQLGNGSKRRSATPVAVADMSDAVELAAGADHTCARRQDGTVRCWGAGECGQLGHGGIGARDTPIEVLGLEGVVQIAAGGALTCARHEDGRVSCWGRNRSGELGMPSMQDEPRPVEAEAVWRVHMPGGRRINVGRGCYVTCSMGGATPGRE